MEPRIEECLIRRATPMCWVTGPSGAGKMALAEAALAHHADSPSLSRRQAPMKQFDGLGILFLSEGEDSPLLWERYGDQERVFA
jgi:hypothetical protein